MKKKVLSFCLLSLIQAAHAENYYSNTANSGYSSSNATSGYNSSNSEGYPAAPQNQLSVSIQLPAQNTQEVYYANRKGPNPPRFYKEKQWVNISAGQPLPPNAVIGGEEHGGPLFVCRAQIRGNVVPGKVVGTKCNIAWFGREVILPQYQVLTSSFRPHWISAGRGYLPPNAMIGGHERNQTLYVCQTYYSHGMHPGKLIDQTCHISWGGSEIVQSQYRVLVR